MIDKTISIATLEERKKDSYQQIMFDSISRSEEIEHICNEISRLTRMKISHRNKEKIRSILAWFDIEDGVKVFTIGYQPSDKKYIGKVDLGDEIMLFYFGLNRKYASWDKYALGVSIKPKENNEMYEYTESSFQENFPKLCDEMLVHIYSGDVDRTYTLIVYPTAAELYKNVKGKKGEWLVQTPSEKGSFVPNKGIGLFDDKNATFYIFEPKPKHIVSKSYIRKFKFLND